MDDARLAPANKSNVKPEIGSAPVPRSTERDLGASVFEAMLVLGLLAGVGFSLFVLFRSLNHGVIDQHDFRQAQTAITIDWLTRGGNWIAYETPVAGYPWTIPFEFPLYQWIVAPFHMMGVPINPAGRVVNWCLYLAAIALAALTMKKLGAQRSFILIFAILVFFSPLYAFWSRTVMIESTALAMSMLFVYAISDYVRRPNWRAAALAIVGGVLGGMVKITTFVPFALAGGVVTSIFLLRALIVEKNIQSAVRLSLAPAFAVIISLGATDLWVSYSDSLKAQNPFGTLLLSNALQSWTFGNIEERLNLANWTRIVFGRSASDAVGSPWIILAVLPLLLVFYRRLAWAIPALLLYLSAFVVFAHLHFVHNYYQYANAGFLILFVAAGIHAVTRIGSKGALANVGRALALVLVVVAIGIDLARFQKEFWPPLIVDQAPNRIYTLAGRIKERTAPEDVAFVFGYDWSPSVAYAAERRTITLPPWGMAPVLLKPLEALTGGRAIDIVVDCERDSKSATAPLIEKASAGLKKYELAGCNVYDRIGAETVDEQAAPLGPPPTMETDMKLADKAALLKTASGAMAQHAQLIQEHARDGSLVDGIFAHAPTDLMLDLAPGTRQLIVNFGLRPEAYTATGKTKGVCFSAQAIGSNIPTDGGELWRRCLKPREVADDRGMQEQAIDVPEGATKMLLRTSAATDGSIDFGWSYWAAVRTR